MKPVDAESMHTVKYCNRIVILLESIWKCLLQPSSDNVKHHLRACYHVLFVWVYLLQKLQWLTLISVEPIVAMDVGHHLLPVDNLCEHYSQLVSCQGNDKGSINVTILQSAILIS